MIIKIFCGLFYPHIALDNDGEPLSLELYEIEDNIFNCLIKFNNSEVLRSFAFDKEFLVDRKRIL